MNSGSSAFISAAGHSVPTSLAASWYHTSRASFQPTLPPVRRTTRTVSTCVPDLPASSTALSELLLSGIVRPPRTPSSAVTRTRESQSTMRPASASGEKPPNTTECTAPSRAHASMA
jgi:hypothetical protein